MLFCQTLTFLESAGNLADARRPGAEQETPVVVPRSAGSTLPGNKAQLWPLRTPPPYKDGWVSGLLRNVKDPKLWGIGFIFWLSQWPSFKLLAEYVFSAHTLDTYRSEATSHRWRASFWPNEFVGGTSSEQPHQLNAIWGILELGFEWDYHELGPISTHAFSSGIYESLVLWKRSKTRFKRPGPGWSIENQSDLTVTFH